MTDLKSMLVFSFRAKFEVKEPNQVLEWRQFQQPNKLAKKLARLNAMIFLFEAWNGVKEGTLVNWTCGD